MARSGIASPTHLDENMNTATLGLDRDKVSRPVKQLDEAGKLLVVALSDFTLAPKEVGQPGSARRCVPVEHRPAMTQKEASDGDLRSNVECLP